MPTREQTRTVISGYLKRAAEFTDISAIFNAGKQLSNKELARAIRLSIASEHDAVHLYELIAESVSDPHIKRIFQDIANEEKVHDGEFQKLLSIVDPENERYVQEGKEEANEIFVGGIPHE